MKIWAITRRLLAQNRWLYLFLILWPLLLAGVFLAPGSAPSPVDVASILHQESLYGLALVVFTGSIQLGNEERSRRIAGVLSRAVDRRQYLLALCLAAWIPLVLYAASLLVSAVLLGASESQFGTVMLALVFVGLWTAAVSVFFASWLPSVLASMASLGLISIGVLLGRAWPAFRLGRLLGVLTGTGPALATPPRAEQLWSVWLTAVLLAIVFFAAAVAIFERRDLHLKLD